MVLLIVSCTNEPIEFETADAKANIERGKPADKGKREKSVYLKAFKNTNEYLSFNGRVMSEPVEYTGDLTDIDPTVDWDKDGVEDELVVNQRCYFPRTFQNITINGEVINYSATFKSLIIGYKDVDGDGYKDAIMRGGRSIAYNDPSTFVSYWNETTAYNVGDYVKVYEQCCAPTTYYCMVANTGELPSSESTSWRLAMNVGYNVEGEAIPLKDIIQSLVITNVDPNPEFVKWDLSEYGINNFTFHVRLLSSTDPTFVGSQTTTYGEFGYYSKDRLTQGETYIIRFTNLGDDCTDIDVEFTL